MKDSLIIQNATTQLVKIPLKRPFVTNLHTVTAINAVKLTVTLANGMVGVGAATPNRVVTGDNLTSMKAILDEVIIPQMIGASLTHFEPLENKLQDCVVGNPGAKAAFDIAVYDLLCQIYHVPLNHLLGGSKQSMATDYTISIGDRDQMVAEAQDLVKQGFTALKIKIGNAPIEEDVATVTAIAKAVGPTISLRLDVNQAWSYKQARRGLALLAAAGLNIAFVEQPLPADQLHDLARLRQESDLPIMLDESVFSPADALRVVSAHAADYINIKLMKAGGIYQATKINQICEAAGVPCMVGCMIEAPGSIAAAVAFANAHANVRFIDLDSIYMIDENVDLGPVKRVGTHLWHA